MARTIRRIAAIALLGGVVAVVYLGREAVLISIGAQLVRVDPLSRADAIVVLGGGTPLREMEAADLYRAGYAPRVLLTIEREASAWDVLRARGVEFENRIDFRKRIMRSLGVPETSLTVLSSMPVNSTVSEVELVREWASANEAERIIIVTASYHTARASLVFRRKLRVDGVAVLARSAVSDPFRPHDWWKDRDELRNGIIEWQKLVFYYVAYR